MIFPFACLSVFQQMQCTNRSVVDGSNALIYLFGGTANTSQVQIFDANAMTVELFYLQLNENEYLEETLNFFPLLFGGETLLLMGGESDMFIPHNSVYQIALSELNSFYFDELKESNPLSAMGRYSTADGHHIDVQIQINLQTNTVYLTLDGPASKYFAIGFAAERMSDRSYTIFVYGDDASNVRIEERRMNASQWRSSGNLLKESMLQIDEVLDYESTEQINGNNVMYRTVKMHRHRIGISNEHFTFPAEESRVDVIYAHGDLDSNGEPGYHLPTNRGDADLLFLSVACKSDGVICTDPNIDCCLNPLSQCDDVIFFDINGVPMTQGACCIAADDDESDCFMDNECCGDYRCQLGKCVEPICFEDGHECSVGDCCTRSISKCAERYFNGFMDAERVCCIESINSDTCVPSGCCEFAQCDDETQTCRFPMYAACASNDECLTGLQCLNGACAAVPTPEPTIPPTDAPSDNPTPSPTKNPTQKPTTSYETSF